MSVMLVSAGTKSVIEGHPGFFKKRQLVFGTDNDALYIRTSAGVEILGSHDSYATALHMKGTLSSSDSFTALSPAANDTYYISGTFTSAAGTTYAQGSVIYYNGSSWVLLFPSTIATQTSIGICDTAAATAEKAVSLAGYVLIDGSSFEFKSTYGNTATANITLNVNGTGAYKIAINSRGYFTWAAGAILSVRYFGTYYFISSIHAGAVSGINPEIMANLHGTADIATKAINIYDGDTGSIPYQTEAGKTTFLSAGSDKNVLIYDATNKAPAWVAQSSITAGNISGGDVGKIPYQSAKDKTTFLDAGTSGSVLISHGTGDAPAWVAQSTLSVDNADTVDNCHASDFAKSTHSHSGYLTTNYSSGMTLNLTVVP